MYSYFVRHRDRSSLDLGREFWEAEEYTEKQPQKRAEDKVLERLESTPMVKEKKQN
jgi:hypothetical protein